MIRADVLFAFASDQQRASTRTLHLSKTEDVTATAGSYVTEVVADTLCLQQARYRRGRRCQGQWWLAPLVGSGAALVSAWRSAALMLHFSPGAVNAGNILVKPSLTPTLRRDQPRQTTALATHGHPACRFPHCRRRRTDPVARYLEESVRQLSKPLTHDFEGIGQTSPR